MTQRWKDLAEAVRTRRDLLGLRQKDMAGCGGPSYETMRLIEKGEPGPYQSRTVTGLEKALLWKPGTVQAILDGEASDDPSQWITAESGLNTVAAAIAAIGKSVPSMADIIGDSGAMRAMEMLAKGAPTIPNLLPDPKVFEGLRALEGVKFAEVCEADDLAQPEAPPSEGPVVREYQPDDPNPRVQALLATVHTGLEFVNTIKRNHRDDPQAALVCDVVLAFIYDITKEGA